MQPYEEFEHKWADFISASPRNVVACASGTAALHLGLEALRLNQGSEVLVPDFTMIACARAVVMAGLRPIFIDCMPDLLMDNELLEIGGIQRFQGNWRYTVDKVAAIMAVHVYGRRCNMQEINDIAKHYQGKTVQGPYIIEDMAEIHGVNPHPETDVACWSFYKNKVVAGEEGGAVYFKDHSKAQMARQLRSLGFTADHDFTHIPRGHNYRLSNVHAELILKSLHHYYDNVSKRWDIHEVYEGLCPSRWKICSRQVPWVYPLRIPELNLGKIPYTGKSTLMDSLVAALNAQGVRARHGFKPMSWQPEFYGTPPVVRSKSGSLAMKMSREVIYLPLDPTQPADISRRAFEIINRMVGA